jgi:hypothetical protein
MDARGENVYTREIRKYEGKRPLGELVCKWEDNIKWIVKIGCGFGLDSFPSEQGWALVNTVINLQIS